MALKTNTKKAAENLFEYIAQAIDEEMIPESATREDMAKAIVNRFEDYYNGDNRRHKMNKQDLFEDWASGLTCGGLFDYYLGTAVETLGGILEETPEERAKYTEDQASKWLTYMIYRNAYKYGKQ